MLSIRWLIGNVIDLIDGIMGEKILIFICVFIASGMLYAQSGKPFELRGVVLDSLTNETLPFVSIAVKGTRDGTTSYVNGHYSLIIDKPCVLQVSYLGYKTKEIEITDTLLNKNQNELLVIKLVFGGLPEIITRIGRRVESKREFVISEEGMISGSKIKNRESIFYNPNEFQLKFFLSNRY